MQNQISICNTSIRQINGLYSINDLHIASGNLKKHQPSNWLANQQTIDFIAECEKTGNPVIFKKQGIGTFVCKELVIHYAMWISPAFSLQVIQHFLNSLSGSLKPDALKTKTALPNGLTLEQQDEIKKFHRELVQTAPKEKQAKLAIQLWSSVKSKFGVSYKEVASEHYPEVLSLMARVAVEQNQALSGEVLDKPQNPQSLPIEYFEHLAKMIHYADSYRKIQELMCNNPNSKSAQDFLTSLNYSTNPKQTGYLFVFKPNIQKDVNDAMNSLHYYSQFA
ncbi:KilA-N domain-containing protein [Simonsiella muelleri]|uniref:KilA-N domain-containing protein n=1 Tax=Simonsiella muelleri TaxID=72 RepID=UPI0001D0925C|nr:KilA-N domain-containing protein [Simonsiella muelleri]AUX61702.1 hypothetical protein BWP33_07745 [Simonsiella muelleri ATCC 29453]UBQ53779.1 KilA-N domain-containing protein [Simonsiella muelleri]